VPSGRAKGADDSRPLAYGGVDALEQLVLGDQPQRGDGGRLGVLWTTRDREVPWLRGLDLRRDPPAPGGVRHREITLPDTGLFGPPVTASFRFTRPMTIESIVDMLATYSGVITAEPGERAAALAYALDRLKQQFPGAGEIDVPMRAWCWRADRVNS